MATVELILYHAQTPTGTVEWSTTSDTGPWTAVQLSGPLPLRDALAEWAAAIAAAASRTVTWEDTSGGIGQPTIVLSASGGALWIRISQTLADLIGCTPLVLEDGDGDGAQALGIATLPVGQPMPFEEEGAEVRKYSAGRASASHFARTGLVEFDLLVPSSLRDDLADTALVNGDAAIKITWDNEDDYGEADLDGALIVYPTAAEIAERDHEDEPIVIHITGSTLDPGASIPTVGDSAWSEFWGALPYGYSARRIARVEGCPILPVELVGDAIAPAGYTLDASLVIDTSSMIGPVVVDSGMSAAYDLDLRLLDTPAVRALMQRPTVVTQLRDDCDVGDLALLVEGIGGWTVGDIAYFGTSGEEVTAVLPRVLSIGNRGDYGRERFFPKGTPVTNAPTEWQDKRVDLYAVLRDPTGRYVQGTDILDGAVALWGGYVQDKPIRNGSEWSIQCRDQARRMAQPLGVAASGKAVWEVDDDSLVAVDPSASIALQIRTNAADLESVVVRPFAGLTGQKRRSELRALIAAALEAAATASGLVSGFVWRRRTQSDSAAGTNTYYDVWGLYADVDVTTSDFYVRGGAAPAGSSDFMAEFRGEIGTTSHDGTATTIPCYMGLITIAVVSNATLSVDLDEGDPAALPTSGAVMIEGDGRRAIRRYSNAAVDDTNGRINLILEVGSALTQEEILALAANPEADMSARFFWRDTGPIYDVLRRTIVSTGDGSGGTYDTLPKGQGLELPAIDEDSFVEAFDGFFRDLTFDLGADAGTTLEELVTGILQLSQRGLTVRRNASATELQIAAIRTGSVDSVPVATITEDTLAFTGRKPVRVVEVGGAPQSIVVRCRSLAVGDQSPGEGTISLRKAGRQPSRSWALDVYGVSRSSVLAAARAWALALFRAGENRQAIEVDVPAWVDAQPGDCVRVDITDPNVWDYALGLPGLTGVVRVTGAQLSPNTHYQTLRLSADGIMGPGPMAPSLAIAAVNGSATAPTSIDVTDADGETYDLLTAAKDGESTWKVLAYLPGQDAGRAEYTVTTVTAPGGGVTRLTVSVAAANPTVTLTTSYRLTWPIATECTAEQDRYLHNTDPVQWG
ncbi:MAG: hypothetical protein IT379_24630 [Deltaproteobacteria bacterium]|nr:hypothetical protein [Deltaproteobacteria bacterium]